MIALAALGSLFFEAAKECLPGGPSSHFSLPQSSSASRFTAGGRPAPARGTRCARC
jgi:hypothetical protein